MGRLTSAPSPLGHPLQISTSDDTARVRLTSSLIGWNQFLQEPPVINVRVLRSHSFLLAAAAEEALQGSWTGSPMCVCERESERGREREGAEHVCTADWVRGAERTQYCCHHRRTSSTPRISAFSPSLLFCPLAFWWKVSAFAGAGAHCVLSSFSYLCVCGDAPVDLSVFLCSRRGSERPTLYRR